MNIERPSIPKYFSESLTLEDLGIYSDDEIGYQPNKRPIFTVYVENNRNTLNNDLWNNGCVCILLFLVSVRLSHAVLLP